MEEKTACRHGARTLANIRAYPALFAGMRDFAWSRSPGGNDGFRAGVSCRLWRIDFIDAGEQGGTAKALETGRIDAAMLDPAHSAELSSKGFSVLMDMRAADIPGVLTALVVYGAYLREHADVVEKVVAGLVEGIAYSLSPRNKEIVLKTLMTHFELQSREAAERGYESLRSRVNRKPLRLAPRDG